ncbi:carbohydrate ABC transporter membrane protein 1 (CUT1 family) [Hydrogenispora ethanolica]|jgi:raffinose/stachyose/melibiose transport system permease protein|uniref:Carbohydrate ABC transporter membrane protein 1 (CUT1 family) n=1 Tax=Hydrogenispora ethanolica TaxID=1082276 RepID=A0A4R1S7B5_HYDET|nr:sugar ABC transporter permease [Hydrogenispora ethanolica]TCL75129.1 carbohydrate ABC transporter membrane protein 1 (CUT1 family) [Hydrogenispora ethanolica]
MNKSKIYPGYFLIGALAIYFVLLLLPSLVGIYYSFTDWNSFDPAIHFVGLANFKKVFSADELYGFYIWNTIKFTLFTTFLKTLIGFGAALLLIRNVKWINFHRMVMFSPQVLSFVIVGLIFRSLFNPTEGFINETLKLIGLGALGQNWLGDIKWAFSSIMAVDTWKGAGYLMVLFIAGLKSIPEMYYEAAEIDGANYFQKMAKVTLPLIMPVITITLVLNITYGLRVFDSVYVLTNGGPGFATGVLNTVVFKEFSKGTYAVGSALSTILFVFICTFCYFLIQAMNKKEVDY